MRSFTRSGFFALLVSLISTALIPPAAQAHAVVTESSLTSESIHPHQATTVVLYFNSNVELKLSRVFLVSKGDVFHKVDFNRGKKPGELRIQIPALEPGDYAIKYKVLAADGHFTENAIRFSVSE